MTSEMPRFKSVKDKYAAMLLALPNVTGVGVGFKKSQDREGGPLAIQVFVSHKVPTEELLDSEIVPIELDGCPTDVVVMPQLSARG